MYRLCRFGRNDLWLDRRCSEPLHEIRILTISKTKFPRSDYLIWRTIPTRWSDNDVYGHVNNVVYYEWFDTAVNSLLVDAGVLDLAQGQAIGLVVETGCAYFASVAYPETVEAGVRVSRLGNSSVRYEVGIFKPGEPYAAAAGHFVHVYVDRDSRRPVPLSAPLRALLEPLLGPPTISEPVSTPEQDRAVVDRIMVGRRSVRAFLPQMVSRATVHEILDAASRAPSGVNTQPWQVRVLAGEPLRKFCDRLCEVVDDPVQSAQHQYEYAYYPHEWVSPYVDRRRQVGWALYGLLGIERGDHVRMHAQSRRNFRFFDAPVGLIFTIDRVLQQGSWLDYGMFLQNVMLAARARGLDTCPQAAFAQFHRVIYEALEIPQHQMLVCGMALGHADSAAIENTLQTPREAVDQFTFFQGF